MDDFGLDRQELTGSLISLEFGPAGRIQQLWASDPTFPDENEEFQFVAPPLNMGEEVSEDYYPGTILLGARFSPDEPWVVSRNARAAVEEREDASGIVGFEYEFPFLEELRATGNFSEILGPAPQICWDLKLTNRSRRSVEIGELGFPLALNNVYEGFPQTERGMRALFHERVRIHKFIGGTASYLFAQRLNAVPPGLLIFPGDDTRWEFYHHVPASLQTPLRWEGIPVVYVHSQGVAEREGWAEWFLGNTSAILEPGESRSYQMRFAPADRNRLDNVNAVLAACGKPAFRLFPSAVAPANVGIAVEVQGVTPTRFFADVEADLETDADEDGGFCFIKPEQPSAARLVLADSQDRVSEAHLLFTEPIASLIEARARWIVEHQVAPDGGPFAGAILPADNTTATPITDLDLYSSPLGIESALADMLFLAEKNAHFPVEDEIAAVERSIEVFVRGRVQNPGDGTLGVVLPDAHSVAISHGNAPAYASAACLYHSMSRVARLWPSARKSSKCYLSLAGRTVLAMFAHALMPQTGVALMSFLPEIADDLDASGEEGMAREIRLKLEERGRQLARRRYPAAIEGLGTAGLEESYMVARRRGDHEAQERIERCANAARSLSPSWWWYGSGTRWIDDSENLGQSAMSDRGQLCHGPDSIAAATMMWKNLERDYANLPDSELRQAFGGMMGVWALVRADGAASMGFCPDEASKHYGMSWITGDIGISLYYYLRRMSAYVLPSWRQGGVLTFGCFFEAEPNEKGETFTVRPWDGIGRRIVVRQLGVEVSAECGSIEELSFNSQKSSATITLHNPAMKDLSARICVRGLWGERFTINDAASEVRGGALTFEQTIPARSSAQARIQGEA